MTVPALTVVLESVSDEQAAAIAAAISQLRGVERVMPGAMAYVRALKARVEATEADAAEYLRILHELDPPPMG